MLNTVNAKFLNPNLVQDNPVHRIDERYRYYYTIKNDEVIIYPSVTSILSSVMPTSDYLIKWYADLGFQKAKEKMHELALYGTFMHICFSELLINRKYDLSQIPANIEKFAEENHIDFYIENWEKDIKDDLLAFKNFCIEFEVQPIAVEIPLLSNKYKFSGTIDAVVTMKIGSGVGGNILKADLKRKADGSIAVDNRKQITAIIDFKSGRHAFYPENEAQLAMYKMLWEDNFPDFPIDKVYNWAPKGWIDTPSYTLKDQSNSIEKEKIPYYISIFEIDEAHRNPQLHHTIDGIIDLDELDEASLQIYIEDLQTKLKREKLLDGDLNGDNLNNFLYDDIN